jgi:hypothetical protein
MAKAKLRSARRPDFWWRAAAAVLAVPIVTALPSAADAKVTKFEIVSVEPAFVGRSFGATGPYEKITARATIGVDPADRHNSIVVDLDRAPRNAAGLVEAISEVVILRPADPAKTNHRLLYEAVNRSRILDLALFNDAIDTSEMMTAAEAGNGFLMNRGYTLVWAGWQGDLPSAKGRLVMSLPVVPGVTGVSREEYVFDNLTDPVTATLTYPSADLDPARAKLTVRAREADARATPADLSFTYDGPSKIRIARPAGYDAGALYEFIYSAKDPKPMGLGFVAARDVVSFLRNDKADAGGVPNPLAGAGIERAIGFGISQSGRYIRDFLYQGFDEDEAGRVVFEGLMPHIGGSKKTFVNYRFGQPGRNVQQHADHLFPGDQFPFTYPVLTDTVSGRSDGLLARCLAANNCPKVIQTDTELEIYQSRASLVATDTKGNGVAMPENVRLYLIADSPHFSPFGAKAVPSAICEQPINPLHGGDPLRALLVAMDGWIGAGMAPPASRYPSRADGTWVPPEEDAASFPKIAGFNYGGVVNRPTLVDHMVMPPKPGAPYPVFVAKRDADGHDLAGIRLPLLDAPTATLLGFNYRKSGFAQGELCDNFGSSLPFAKTRVERLAADDPRPSLEERYPHPGDYVAAVTRSTEALVAARLLLPEDAERMVAEAKQTE